MSDETAYQPTRYAMIAIETRVPVDLRHDERVAGEIALAAQEFANENYGRDYDGSEPEPASTPGDWPVISHDSADDPAYQAWRAAQMTPVHDQSAYPPGTPVHTNKYETYPTVVLWPPASVGGNRVLAWSEDRRRDGEYPGGVVLTVRDPEHGRGEYAVWGAYTKDAGRTWIVSDSGSYPVEYTDAWHEFTRRAQRRPATEF